MNSAYIKMGAAKAPRAAGRCQTALKREGPGPRGDSGSASGTARHRSAFAPGRGSTLRVNDALLQSFLASSEIAARVLGRTRRERCWFDVHSTISRPDVLVTMPASRVRRPSSPTSVRDWREALPSARSQFLCARRPPGHADQDPVDHHSRQWRNGWFRHAYAVRGIKWGVMD